MIFRPAGLVSQLPIQMLLIVNHRWQARFHGSGNAEAGQITGVDFLPAKAK